MSFCQLCMWYKTGIILMVYSPTYEFKIPNKGLSIVDTIKLGYLAPLCDGRDGRLRWHCSSIIMTIHLYVCILSASSKLSCCNCAGIYIYLQYYLPVGGAVFILRNGILDSCNSPPLTQDWTSLGGWNSAQLWNIAASWACSQVRPSLKRFVITELSLRQEIQGDFHKAWRFTIW